MQCTFSRGWISLAFCCIHAQHTVMRETFDDILGECDTVDAILLKHHREHWSPMWVSEGWAILCECIAT